MPRVSGKTVRKATKAGKKVAEALWKRIAKSSWTHGLVSGTLTPMAVDYRQNDDPNAKFIVTTLEDMASGKFWKDKDRKFNYFTNTAFAGAGGAAMKWSPVFGLGAHFGIPTKDIMFNSLTIPGKVKTYLDTATQAANATIQNQQEELHTRQNMNSLIKWLGIGALGLGGFGLLKLLKNKKKKDGAKMKVKLPGKKGEIGTEAEVEIPIDMPKMPTNMTEGLDRAVRFRTRKSIQANSMKRDPQTGKLIPYDEWKAKYGGGRMPMPGAAPEIPPQMQAQLEKSSGTREFHEELGDLLFRGAGAVGGMMGGGWLAQKFGKDPLMGAIPGVVLGGLVQPLLGRVTASFSGKRDKEEQEEHDEEDPLGEYILPGYAQHQMIQRKNALKDQIAASSYDATGEDFPPSFAGGGDWEKDAMAPPGGPPPPQGPPPPPGGGPPPPQGPPPQKPGPQRQIDPYQNRTAQGLPKAGDLKKVQDMSDRVHANTRIAAEKVQPRQVQRPQSLADINSTMGNVHDTLDRVRTSRFTGGLDEIKQQNYA